VKRWTVVYSDGAKVDILGIVDYIARDSVINADKVLARLEKRIRTLDLLPERGRVVPELQWHGMTSVREIFEKPWRILYQIKGGEVLVVAVYDSRRHLNDVLMERFLRH
jgi:plasmid stabilization system protein ParE